MKSHQYLKKGLFMNRTFDVNQFENLPQSLCKSNYIDILLFLCGHKPVVRFLYSNTKIKNEIIQWCNRYNYSFALFNDHMIYISKFIILAYLAKFIDNAKFKHEYIFGLLLGYPKCCCRKISSIGEENIDAYEETMKNSRIYQSDFKFINPKGYIEGSALISHIPCSTECKKSLEIAKAALLIIHQNTENPAFSLWKNA